MIASIFPCFQESFTVVLYGKDVALSRFLQAGLPAKDIMKQVTGVTVEIMIDFLKSQKIDLLVTSTTGDDITERFLWKAAEICKIPSIAILDQWCNYGIRFSPFDGNMLVQYEKQKTHPYLPTKIAVMDALAKEKMVEEGIDSSRIVVTGQPYFKSIREKGEACSKEKIATYKGTYTKEEEKLFLFASEPISETYYMENITKVGYTEQDAFRLFQSSLEKTAEKLKKKVCVIVRPHPKESEKKWKSWTKDTPWVRYVLDRKEEVTVAIQAADVIVGMSSMLLLESVLMGKPVVSILPLEQGDKNSEYVLEQLGLDRSIRSQEEMQVCLQNCLHGKLPVIDWKIGEDAQEKILTLAKTCMEQSSTNLLSG